MHIEIFEIFLQYLVELYISCKDGVSCTRMVAFLCFLLELSLMNKLHEQTLLGSITFIPDEIF